MKRSLAHILDVLAAPGNPHSSPTESLFQFNAQNPPQISIGEYLERLTKYAPINDELLVVSLIYLDRLKIPVSPLNIHRLLLTSILVSVKFYSDIFYSNSYFARVGGIQAHEINELEMLFLRQLNFALIVKQDEYKFYQNEILRHSTGQIEPHQPMETLYSSPPAALEIHHQIVLPAPAVPSTHNSPRVSQKTAESPMSAAVVLLRKSQTGGRPPPKPRPRSFDFSGLNVDHSTSPSPRSITPKPSLDGKLLESELQQYMALQPPTTSSTSSTTVNTPSMLSTFLTSPQEHDWSYLDGFGDEEIVLTPWATTPVSFCSSNSSTLASTPNSGYIEYQSCKSASTGDLRAFDPSLALPPLTNK